MANDILVIEDDPGIARIIRLYLERDGHRVTTAGDGVAGLNAARTDNPDLIVLDLMLPRLDGMSVCPGPARGIRRTHHHGHCPRGRR